MGADFKGKTKKSFEKCWDKAAVAANTPTLFSNGCDDISRIFEAEAIGNDKFDVGESIILRIESGSVVGHRGVTPVLRIIAPTPALMEAICLGSNIARAEIMTADLISGVYEVVVC